MNEVTLKSKLPFWGVHGDHSVFQDGSFVGGFRIEGLDLTSASDDEINRHFQGWKNILLMIPENYKLSLHLNVGNDQEDLICKHMEQNKNEVEAYLAIRESRHTHLLNRNKTGSYFNPHLSLFIRSRPYEFKRKSFLKRETFEDISQQDFDNHLNDFTTVLTQLEGALHGMGVRPHRLNQSEQKLLQFHWFNPGRDKAIGMASSVGEIDRMILTDLQINENYLKLGDYFLSAVSLKNLPEGETFAAMARSLACLPFPVRIVQTLQIPNQSKVQQSLHLGRRFSHSMAFGNKELTDLESANQLAGIEALIQDLLSGSERMVNGELLIWVWDKDMNQLKDHLNEVLRSLRLMNQAEGVIETLALSELWPASTPGVCQGKRFKQLKSSNAAQMLASFDCWRGNARPICLLPNRDQVLFKFDPFAPELPNWNGLVFGGSGAGKSFSISQMMLQFYGQHPTPKIVWIDNGASTQTLLEALDGEFIALSLESGIRLNPFDLEHGETGPTSSKVKLILAVMESVFKDPKEPSLPKREKALLEECIFQVYQKCSPKIPTLSDLRDLLLNHRMDTLKGYGEILYSWVGNTAYGKMLDGESNVKLQKDLITIEMKGLDNYPDLQNVFLLLFTDFIKNEAARDTRRPYLLIIDEAWRLFETSSGLSFTVEAYRTFRKFMGGIWCISQNYKDFLGNAEIKNALFPNTTSVFILRQRKIDWKDFQESLGLNDNEVEAVKSLEIVKGKYSEFFLMQDEKRAILRIEPDSLSYWLCTSDGQDRAKILEMSQKYPKENKLQIVQRIVAGET